MLRTASCKTSALGITEECIAQIYQENEERVIKILFQEFSRTESRILGALYKLDEFLLNAQVRAFTGTVPGTFRNTDIQTRNQAGIVLRMIKILKWCSLPVVPET